MDKSGSSTRAKQGGKDKEREKERFGSAEPRFRERILTTNNKAKGFFLLFYVFILSSAQEHHGGPKVHSPQHGLDFVNNSNNTSKAKSP